MENKPYNLDEDYYTIHLVNRNGEVVTLYDRVEIEKAFRLMSNTNARNLVMTRTTTTVILDKLNDTWKPDT